MNKTIVYSKNGCMNCKRLKNQLNEIGIKYEDCQDVEKMRQENIDKLPVLFYEGKKYNYSEAVKWLSERRKI